MSDNLSETDTFISNAINPTILDQIRQVHKKVSSIFTPDGQVGSRLGFDYVKIGYMKRIANEYYPGWSWKIIEKKEIFENFFMVHGRLIWNDCGVVRIGDMVAAHRVQMKKDGTEFVDAGNDIKAANTDTLKKAFNLYMNISDDIYRNSDETLPDDLANEVINLAKKIGDEYLEKTMRIKVKDIIKMIDKEQINRSNFQSKMESLNSYLEMKNNEVQDANE